MEGGVRRFMNCGNCEELLSDYLEEMLGLDTHRAVEQHLEICPACAELSFGMKALILEEKSFVSYDPPAWLAPRILANTPRVARETWRDTLAGLVYWIIEPRMAMIVFTASIVLGWMGSLAGITPLGVVRVVRDPTIVYYEAGTQLNRAYGSAVRSYYSAPLVTRIQAQIDRLRESS